MFKTFLIIFFSMIVLISCIAYWIYSHINFKNKLNHAIEKYNFSTEHKIISIGNTGLKVLKDNNINKFGIINPSSEKFLVNICDDFEISNSITNNTMFLGIDNNKRKICLITKGTNSNPIIRILESKDIIAVEISETVNSETKTLTKTNRGSQALGAAVGWATLGPAGFLVGGLTGTKTSKSKKIETVNNIELKVTINDLSDPVKSFSLLEIPSKKDSLIYKNAIQKAELWNGIFKVIINYK